jgi:hypothetical protein
MNEIETMTGMTDAEADAWDAYFTQNPPDVDASKNRILTGEGLVARMVRHDMALSNRIIGELDSDALEYVCAQAVATGKTHAEVASAIIRRK